MSAVFRFKVELLGIQPSVWRRIEVPCDYSFWDLHVAIQDSMGWSDSHLHAFELPSGKDEFKEVGVPDPDGMSDVVAGWKRTLKGFFEAPGDQLVYEYDFGDSWRHSVLLEGIILAAAGVKYPVCVAGARRCPPEDCGGEPGYEDFLAAISDDSHSRHRDMLEWSGGEFDPEEFDPLSILFDDPSVRRENLE